MIINFDTFNKARIPSLILCNPNGDRLFSMKMAKDRRLSIKLNALSGLTFTVSKYKDKTLIPYYDYLITRRYVEIEGVGKFIITEVKTKNDGLVEYKEVVCKGLEMEMASKNMGLVEGTYKFYDPTSNDSLMGIVLSYLPNWSIGEIEASLWNTYRTFDIKDNNVYNFLMTEVQETYQCIFIVDTFRRTISAKKIDTIIKPTDIFMSDRNLVKELSIEENSNDVKTALNIYGDGDLSIHSVNPLGTATIYDFSYYKSVDDMMSKGLIDAITRWESKLNGYQSEYSNILAQIKTINTNIISLGTEKTELESQLFALEEEENMKMVAGEDLSDVNGRITSKKSQITQKAKDIEAKKSELVIKQNRLKAISTDLKFENNFTRTELDELSTYIHQESYQCTNFSVTDTMTDVEKQEVMQELFDYGKEQLKSVAQPTYKFDIDCVNFLRLFDYKYVIEQFELGCEITICVDREKDRYARVVLLGYDINLDDPDDLELHFSNRLKFGDEKYLWQELMDTANSINTSVNFESPSWSKGEIANSKIDDYKNSAFDLTQQEIISSDNQEFTLTHQGLRGREWDAANNRYLPEQIWMNKNVLAFSDNGFNGRPRMALGKILAPDGTRVYGLNAEVIVGNIMLTKKLVVENANSTFRVDGEKVFIKNADIIVTSDGKESTLSDALANSGSKVYYQTSQPASGKEGDVWYDTDNQNKVYVYKNSLWQSATDKDIAKINSVITSDGKLDASKMKGEILTGRNNIVCSNINTGKVLALNENGIIVGTMTNGIISQTGTFITKDGIVADAITSGTINAININGSVFQAKMPDGSNVKLGEGTPVTIFRDAAQTKKGAEIWADPIGSPYVRLYKTNGEESLAIVGARSDSSSSQISCPTALKVISDNSNLTLQGYTTMDLNAYGGDVNVNANFGTGKMIVRGSITASGSKPATVNTGQYGWRQLYSEESDRIYFNTHGSSSTMLGEDGRFKKVIRLDDVFLETIELNSTSQYLVQLTTNSLCNIACIKKYDKYIIVESSEETDFDYTIRCLRKGYIDTYLEEVGNIFREDSMDEFSVRRRIK